MCSDDFTANLLVNLLVKDFLKPANNWRSSGAWVQ